MTLNDVKFKPWRNGSKNKSTEYGLCVSKEHALLFPKAWNSIIVTVTKDNESEDISFNLKSTFWTTCPDIKNIKIKKWLILSNTIGWEGKKPLFNTSYIGDNHFKIQF